MNFFVLIISYLILWTVGNKELAHGWLQCSLVNEPDPYIEGPGASAYIVSFPTPS